MTGPVDWDALVIGPNMDVFGGPVEYRPEAGAPFDITGIYDAGNKQLVLLEDGSTVLNESGPVLGVQLAQFAGHAAPQQDDQLYIGNVGRIVVNKTFIVRDVQDDSHGAAKLSLNIVRIGP